MTLEVFHIVLVRSRFYCPEDFADGNDRNGCAEINGNLRRLLVTCVLGASFDIVEARIFQSRLEGRLTVAARKGSGDDSPYS